MTVGWEWILRLLGKKAQASPNSDCKQSCSCPQTNTKQASSILFERKRITRVFIEDGCIPCGACHAECPEVFFVDPKTSDTAIVVRGAGDYFPELKDRIEAAADGCCLSVIKIEYEDGTRRPSPQEIRMLKMQKPSV